VHFFAFDISSDEAGRKWVWPYERGWRLAVGGRFDSCAAFVPCGKGKGDRSGAGANLQ